MKFSNILKGTRAERVVELPGHTKPDGAPVTIALRPLTGAEEKQVLEAALTDARAAGVTAPRPGEQLYDLAVMAHTLVLGCLDPESPPETRAPFFDAGAEHLLANLNAETIGYLFERHDQWQSECSPYVRKMGADELLAAVSEVAGPDGEAAFTRMSPGMRWSFTRSLARLLLCSPDLKSLCSSTSDDVTTAATATQ